MPARSRGDARRPGRQAAPAAHLDGAEPSGGDRRLEAYRRACVRSGGPRLRRSDLDRQAIRRPASDRLQKAGDRGEPDHARVRERDVELPERLRAPQCARPHHPLRDEGDVDEGRVMLRPVDGHEEALVRGVGHVGGHAPGHREPGREAGHRRLAVVREGVVGPRRDGGDGGPAALRRHRAVGAVAAQDDDGRDLLVEHGADRAAGVFRRAGHREVEAPHGSEALAARVPGPLDPAFDVGVDAAPFRHRDDLPHAAGPEAGKDPEHDVRPVRDLEARRVGDDAADVPRGEGVRDEADPHSVPSRWRAGEPPSCPSAPAAAEGLHETAARANRTGRSAGGFVGCPRTRFARHRPGKAGEAPVQGLFTLRNRFARANPVWSIQSGPCQGSPGNGAS